MPKSQLARRATYIVISLNAFLLILKAVASSLSDSLAILSETVNSLTDVFASVAVLICVRMAAHGADEKHPFGHTRAEPIAGLVVAIFTAIMGWEILRSMLDRMLSPAKALEIGAMTLPVLIVTLLVKSGMTWYLARTAKAVNSPALKASSQDCRNDILVATLAIVGVVGANRYPVLDTMAAMAIGFYILYNAYEIGRENVDYLMGTVPSPELLGEIRQQAAAVGQVQGVDHIRAHYVGNFVHVELQVHLDGELTTHASHHIAETVKGQVESIPAIDRAFVHVEPASGVTATT